MGVAVGLNSYLGCGEESTWNTGVTPDRFFEFVSEGLERNQKVIQSNGIRAGSRNLRRGARRVLSARSGKGSIDLEVATTSFGRIFKHILGGTPTIAQQASTIAYLHTYAMGSLQGKGLTWQKVVRDSASNVITPLTFTGCKIASAEFSNSVDNMLMCKLDVIAADVLTSTSAASLSYPSVSKLFNFSQGVIKFNNVAVGNIKNWTCKIDNKLKDDRYFIGQAGVQAEPADAADFPEVTGKLAIEFINQATAYDVFAADTGVSLDIIYTGANIASTYYETFQLTVPEIHLLGDTPKIGGPDLVTLDVGYEGASTGSSAGATISYMTTDTTA